MAGKFSPLLTTADWNEEWKALQGARRRSDDAAAWDERAKTYPVKHGSQTGYVQRFLELAQIEPGEAVLDMGCGTGALATPLAQAGHQVIACDFSHGMLDAMAADQAQLGVRGVQAQLLGWADDWGAAGIGAKCVDVALASRSIATRDLRAALMKLDRAARRRVCITLPCSASPRIDERLLTACGFEQRMGRDFQYAFNVLAGEGICPEVAYIPSTRMEIFESPEEALQVFSGIVASAVRGMASEDEMEAIPRRLETWLDGNLVHDAKGYHLSEDRKVTWAFMAWNPR